MFTEGNSTVIEAKDLSLVSQKEINDGVQTLLDAENYSAIEVLEAMKDDSETCLKVAVLAIATALKQKNPDFIKTDKVKFAQGVYAKALSLVIDGLVFNIPTSEFLHAALKANIMNHSRNK